MKSISSFNISLLLLILIQKVIASPILCKEAEYGSALAVICDEDPSALKTCETYNSRFYNKFQFTNCKFANLPNLTFGEFNWLELINISHIGLETIQLENIVKFKTLSQLLANENELNELPVGVFREQKINKMDLTHNHFTEIASIGRSGVEELKNLILSHNNITNISENDLVHLTQLRTLDLSSNNIQHISNLSLATLTLLTTLKLSNNSITTISENTFIGAVGLNVLDLSNNRITNISEKTFADPNQLIRLNLSFNALNVIETAIFENLNSLDSLDLARNNLSHIEFGIFSNLQNLRHLNVSGNHLIKIDLSHLLPLSIWRLNLSNSEINEIDGSLHYAFPGLNKLDLRYNNLNCAHLKSILSNFDDIRGIIEAVPSSELLEGKSYRGIGCHTIKVAVPSTVKSAADMENIEIIPESPKSPTMENDSSNEIFGKMLQQNSDAVKLTNILLMALVAILILIGIGMVLSMCRKSASTASFQRVRKSDLHYADK